VTSALELRPVHAVALDIPVKAEDRRLGRRLDSWKEIAAILARWKELSSAWDVDRGVPIHRVPGGGRASVYAYTRELDEWVKSTKIQESEAALVQPAKMPCQGSLRRSIRRGRRICDGNSRVLEASAPRSVLRRNWVAGVCGLLLAASSAQLSIPRVFGQPASDYPRRSGPVRNIHAESGTRDFDRRFLF